jgi:hypothetical protein
MIVKRSSHPEINPSSHPFFVFASGETNPPVQKTTS